MKITATTTIVQKVITPVARQLPDIKTILERPIEELERLTPEEYKTLFEPYIPLVRASVLPSERPRKMGAEARALMAAVEANKEAIAALKAARTAKKP